LRIRKARHRMTDSNVNITALMDILTVLLFFLIKSFSLSSTSLSIPDGVRLPASFTNSPVVDAVKLSLSEKELKADHQLLANLKNGQFRGSDLSRDHKTITSLKEYLDVQMQKKKALIPEGAREEDETFGKLIIQADKELSFKTLKLVLHTAASSGYEDYQFIVKEEE